MQIIRSDDIKQCPFDGSGLVYDWKWNVIESCLDLYTLCAKKFLIFQINIYHGNINFANIFFESGDIMAIDDVLKHGG